MKTLDPKLKPVFYSDKNRRKVYDLVGNSCDYIEIMLDLISGKYKNMWMVAYESTNEKYKISIMYKDQYEKYITTDNANPADFDCKDEADDDAWGDAYAEHMQRKDEERRIKDDLTSRKNELAKARDSMNLAYENLQEKENEFFHANENSFIYRKKLVNLYSKFTNFLKEFDVNLYYVFDEKLFNEKLNKNSVTRIYEELIKEDFYFKPQFNTIEVFFEGIEAYKKVRGYWEKIHEISKEFDLESNEFEIERQKIWEEWNGKDMDIRFCLDAENALYASEDDYLQKVKIYNQVQRELNSFNNKLAIDAETN